MSWQKDEAPTVYASEVNYTLQSIQPLGLPSGSVLLAKSYFPLTKKDKIKGLQYQQSFPINHDNFCTLQHRIRPRAEQTVLSRQHIHQIYDIFALRATSLSENTGNIFSGDKDEAEEFLPQTLKNLPSNSFCVVSFSVRNNN